MKITREGIAVIEGDTHYGRWIEQRGTIAVDTAVLPEVLLLLKPGMVVVDVGAFIGTHTVPYSNRVGPDGHVFAFEPNPEAFRCLEFNVRGRTNVTITNCGLADKPGTARVMTDPNAGASHLVLGGDEPQVPVTTLDMFHPLSMLGELHVIKLDCEGMELAVIRGGRHTLSTFHPALVIEMNRGAMARYGYQPPEVWRELQRLGYRHYTTIPSGAREEDEQYEIVAHNDSIPAPKH